MYKVTKSILGMAVITAIVGVRQGSPTSCFLFIIFVNVLIRNMKDRCPDDGFLKWLHVLMLMDDTVILATSRERLLEKLNILLRPVSTVVDIFCHSLNKHKKYFLV